MVHLQPLPGSPGWAGSMTAVVDAALADAETLMLGGCDALLVENMGDVPYLKGAVAPETAAAMAVATAAVVELGVPVGVQVLAGANRQALGVAVAAGASFIRAEAFAYGHVADEGWLEATAGELLRARKGLGASVAVWADVQKKHASHAATADLSLAALSQGHAFCGVDALVITGASTGSRTDPGDLQAARSAGLPVVVGSGVDDVDAAELAGLADALIVGSWLKEDSDWRRPVALERVRRVIRAMRG
jgi:hypothetical protein